MWVRASSVTTCCHGRFAWKGVRCGQRMQTPEYLYTVNHYASFQVQNTVDGTQLGPNWLLRLCELSEINHCFYQLLVQRYCILERGHGTSISHLHDHLCGADNDLNGRIVAVDLAPRCLRDLTHLASARPGLVAILGDARKHSGWGVLMPHQVDWLFQDVAQSGQVEIFIDACRRFLTVGGLGLLSLKAASERWTGEGEHVLFTKVEQQLIENGFDVEESIKLTGYEDNHVLFVARRVE